MRIEIHRYETVRYWGNTWSRRGHVFANEVEAGYAAVDREEKEKQLTERKPRSG